MSANRNETKSGKWPKFSVSTFDVEFADIYGIKKVNCDFSSQDFLLPNERVSLS